MMAAGGIGVFKVDRTKDRLSISMSSTMALIDQAEVETRAFLTRRGRTADMFAVCLGMREGMTNAVNHGHRRDAEKIVRYTLEVSANRLEVIIEDEGDGFDWRTVQRTDPDKAAEHGRGLSIIDQYSSRFHFNEKGNTLTFSIESSGRSPAEEPG